MTILTKEQILGANDLPSERIHVPQWGGDVIVRGMTGAERSEVEVGLIAEKPKDKQQALRVLRARTLVLSLVDESGNPLFSRKDIDALNKKSSVALELCFEVAQRLSGMGKKDVEEAVGNSVETQGDDSYSD